MTRRTVPFEPTDAMVDAGLRATAAFLDIKGSALTVNREKMRLRYKAMLNAAPLDELQDAVVMADNRLEAALLDETVCRGCVEVARSYLEPYTDGVSEDGK